MTLVRQHWTRVLLQYPCETCGAAPGQRCVTTSNQPKHEAHAYRTRLASAHQWRLLDEEE